MVRIFRDSNAVHKLRGNGSYRILSSEWGLSLLKKNKKKRRINRKKRKILKKNV